MILLDFLIISYDFLIFLMTPYCFLLFGIISYHFLLFIIGSYYVCPVISNLCLGNSRNVQGSDVPIQKSDRRRPGARRLLDRNPSAPYPTYYFLLFPMNCFYFLLFHVISYYFLLYLLISYYFLLFHGPRLCGGCTAWQCGWHMLNLKCNIKQIELENANAL